MFRLTFIKQDLARGHVEGCQLTCADGAIKPCIVNTVEVAGMVTLEILADENGAAKPAKERVPRTRRGSTIPTPPDLAAAIKEHQKSHPRETATDFTKACNISSRTLKQIEDGTMKTIGRESLERILNHITEAPDRNGEQLNM